MKESASRHLTEEVKRLIKSDLELTWYAIKSLPEESFSKSMTERAFDRIKKVYDWCDFDVLKSVYGK